MPRPPRIQLEGAVYVVTARGLSEEPLFKDSADEHAYLQLLADYHRRHGFRLYAWCLLPDGIHLCLEPGPGSSLSTVMHDLSAGYTRYVNKRYGRSGHLFQARYKAVVAEKAACLLDATAQVHLQPVRLGLVRHAQDHQASSARAYIDGASPVPLATDEVLPQLPASVSGYAGYLASVDHTRVAARFQQAIVGSHEFIATARACARAEGDPSTPSASPWASGRLPRARLAVLTGSAAVLVAGLAVGVTLLSRRVVRLERALVALAQENEATFLAGQSVAQASFAPEIRDLQGTRWDVQIAPLFGQAATSDQDRLEFDERRVTSTALAAQGFGHSPYLMHSRRGGRGTWETAQTNAQGDLVLWQGEWRGSVMQGMVTRQPAGRPAERCTFVAVLREAGAVRSEI
jgi:REP element-mobilizing transposase RayT